MEDVAERGSSWASTSERDWQMLLVTPELVDDLWPLAVPLLLEGKEHWEEFTSLESLKQSVTEGGLLLWLAIDRDGVFLALLTEATVYPETVSMRLVWIGGSGLDRVLEVGLSCLELWAYRHGAKRMEVLGRPAWIRILQGEGYKLKSYLLEKDISKIGVH